MKFPEIWMLSATIGNPNCLCIKSKNYPVLAVHMFVLIFYVQINPVGAWCIRKYCGIVKNLFYLWRMLPIWFPTKKRCNKSCSIKLIIKSTEDNSCTAALIIGTIFGSSFPFYFMRNNGCTSLFQHLLLGGFKGSDCCKLGIKYTLKSHLGNNESLAQPLTQTLKIFELHAGNCTIVLLMIRLGIDRNP